VVVNSTKLIKYCDYFPEMFQGSVIMYRYVMLQMNLLLVCWNKMPTRGNRGFYCRSYCLLNMFRAPLCPSL